MNPLDIILVVAVVVLALAAVIGNNFSHAKYAAVIGDITNKFSGILSGLSGSSSTPSVTHTVIFGGATGQTGTTTSPPLAALPLDPIAAVLMAFNTIADMRYVAYLNALSPADLAAWQGKYVTQAAALAATGTAATSEVWNCATGSIAKITDAQSANLAVLKNLGVTGLVTGSAPGQ